VKITPLEIKKQEFPKQFRGYSPEEVRAYLESIAGEFEEALKKILELEEKITSLEVRISGYTKLEGVLQDALVSTQKSADELRATAEKKARVIIDEARVAADRTLSEARTELLNIRREAEDLKNQRDMFIVSFKSLLDTQHTLLEIIQKKGKEAVDFAPLRMRTDLSDADLERVAGEFEKELGDKEAEAGNGRSLPGGDAN